MTRTYFDADGRRSAEVANLVGQAITVTTPAAFNPAFTDQNLITRWGYDALGRVLTTTLYAGSDQERTDWTCYDPLGRVSHSVINASSADACGRAMPVAQASSDGRSCATGSSSMTRSIVSTRQTAVSPRSVA